MSGYENDEMAERYLLFHYGRAEEVLPWAFGPREALGFAGRVAGRFSPCPEGRGLDVGCAVGRSALEMTRVCGEVVGVDSSRAFVEAAWRMAAEGSARVRRLEEAAERTEVELRLPEEVDAGRVSFEQGDAQDLREGLADFDRVLAANLLCRLGKPRAFLDRLPSLVAPGGELVMTTPATWLEEFTPRKSWPVKRTEDWVKETLEPDFELLEEGEEPFLIRETRRKYQWTVAWLGRWRRRRERVSTA